MNWTVKRSSRRTSTISRWSGWSDIALGSPTRAKVRSSCEYATRDLETVIAARVESSWLDKMKSRMAEIGHIRALIKKVPSRNDQLDINEAILEVIALTRSEVVKNGLSLDTQLANGLPFVRGDRIQLQQVILNLIVNAIEATSGASEGAREVLISSRKDASNGVLVAVRDSGLGLDPTSVDHLFDAFYTTKPGGMGMGLSICRSIIEAHGGRVWATANVPRGAVFHFTLPVGESVQREATLVAGPCL